MDIELQKEVHEDMVTNFDKYPEKWGFSHLDKNIDHRRVPNLMAFFSQHGQFTPIAFDVKSCQRSHRTGDFTHRFDVPIHPNT